MNTIHPLSLNGKTFTKHPGKIVEVAPIGAQTRFGLIVNKSVSLNGTVTAPIVFQCSDALSMYETLKGRGVSVSEPLNLSDGIWISFHDEDQNLFFLKQYTDQKN